MTSGQSVGRLLLTAYPPSFRRRFGRDFVAIFEQEWRQARPLFRGRMAVSALGTAFLERVSALLPQRPIGPGREPRGVGLLPDLKAAARDLARSPGFALLAVLTLAAGIGINATAFSLVDVVLFRDLPYPDPDRIAGVRITRGDGERWNGLSFLEMQRLETRDDLFVAVGGVRPNFGEVLPMDLDVTNVERPEKLQGIEVSPGLFSVLGLEPALGRNVAEEDRDGADGQALNYMVSSEYWRRGLGADPEIVGKALTIEYRAKPIVGVLPPGVRLYFDPEAGVPQRADLWTRIYHLEPDDHYLRTLVRLREDVELDQARAAVAAMAEGWRDERPEIYGDAPPMVEIVPLKSYLTTGSQPLLLALGAATTLVLLLACANAGSLILARCRARDTEFAVRAALGASAARIRRLILIEAVLLSALGAIVGLGASAVSMRTIAALADDLLPRAGDLALGAGTVAFTVGLALVAGLFAGALAVAQRRGSAASASLRQGARLAGSRRAVSYRSALTVIQTAVAVVLLVGAGLMLRTLLNLAAVDLGFDPEGVVTFKVEMNQTQIPLGQPRYEFFRDVAAAVAERPEFESASAVFVLPTMGAFGVDRYGRTIEEMESNDFTASFNVVLPGYFATMGIPLLEGTDFTAEWSGAEVGEAIIEETIAQRLWPGESALGRSLWIDWDRQNSPTIEDRVQVRVVGVAPHLHQDGVRGASAPQIHLPHQHRPFWGMNFVARLRGSSTESDAMAAALRAVGEVVDGDPDAEFMHSERPLAEVVAAETKDGRLLSRVLTVFSALALLLSATGLYGVISYGARQRTREVGIRMATGAQRSDVLWLILRGALQLSGAGVVIGAGLALAVSRLLASLLYGVAATDPFTYALAAGMLFGVGVFAALRPAVRAAATDPVEALRAE